MTGSEKLHTLAFDAVRATVYGLVIIFLLIGATALLGNRQQQALDDINNGTKATACILSLPIDADTGRSQAEVNECLRLYGLTP